MSTLTIACFPTSSNGKDSGTVNNAKHGYTVTNGSKFSLSSTLLCRSFVCFESASAFSMKVSELVTVYAISRSRHSPAESVNIIHATLSIFRHVHKKCII